MAREIINEVVSAKAHKDLDELINKLEKGRLKLIDFLTSAEKADLSKIKLPSDLQNELKKYEDRLRDVNKEIAEQKKLNDDLQKQITRLTNAKRQSNQRTAEEIEGQRVLSRNAREYARLSMKLSTEYEKQSTRLIQLKRHYKDVALRMGENSREAKDLLKDITRLDARLKRVDKSVGESFRNVGNYSSVWGGLGRVVTAAAGAFGAFSAIDIGREIYSQIKQINSLNAALLEITETQEDFNNTTQYLISLADQSGARINSLQQTYTNFFASAKMTNLTLEETQTIFSNVVLAQSKLNRSNDDIIGGLRALEQMLSKGNVQAEEIRGQLGERLPGAFNILAKSMGLTTSELNKQLELGNVIAEEVLPKFAEELAKTYGVDTQTRIENLTASENRMRDEWNLFIRDMENGGGKVSKVFMSIFDSVSFLIEGLRNLNDGDNIRQQETYNNVLKSQTEYYKELGDEAKEYAKINEGRATTAINTIEAEIEAKQKHIDTLKEDNKWMFTNAREVYKTTQEIDRLRISLARETAIRNAAARQIYDHTELLEKNKDQAKKTSDDGKKIIQGSLDALNKEKSALEDQRDRLATTSEERKKYNDQIKAIEENIRKLTVAQKELNNVFSGEGTTSGIFSENDINAFQQYLRDSADYEIYIERQKQEMIRAIREGGLKTYEYLTDEQVRIAEEAADQEKNIRENLNESLESAAKAGINSIFESRIEDIERQKEANDEYYNNLLANEDLTEERREAIEAQRKKEEDKLEKERRKEEQKQFLINQGIALAEVAIQVAKGVAEATAMAPATFGASLSWIPLIIGTGAAQAATIVAQSIPKFEKGTENAPEGWAKVDEKGPELHLDKYNRIKSWGSDSGPNYRYLEKGDKIKTAQETMKLRSFEDVKDLVYSINMQSMGSIPTQNDIDAALLREMSGMREENKQMRAEMRKFASRPIQNHNTIVIDDKKPYY